MSLRLGLVSPRFEPVTTVGAEVQIAGFARRLSERGHSVEILTTCARDPMTWRNHYAPGLYGDRPFPVRRFPVDARRLRRRHIETGWRLERGEQPPEEDQEGWIRSLGSSSALTAFLTEGAPAYDAFIVVPALSGTVWGLPRDVLRRSVLLAALPQGPGGHLGILRRRYGDVPALLTGSRAESRFAQETLALPPDRIVTAAAPVADAPSRDAPGFRRRHGLEVPFLICAGRRSKRKGTGRLIEHVRLLVREGGVDLRLVLIGEEEVEIPQDARDLVLDLRFIGDQDRDDGFAAALALCQPAREERLALTPMEAWLAGRPVLADAAGAVTAERCRASGGGIPYGDYYEFAEAVRLLLGEAETAAAMGAGGRSFALERWSWQRCIAKVEDICTSITAARRVAP